MKRDTGSLCAQQRRRRAKREFSMRFGQTDNEPKTSGHRRNAALGLRSFNHAYATHSQAYPCSQHVCQRCEISSTRPGATTLLSYTYLSTVKQLNCPPPRPI